MSVWNRSTELAHPPRRLSSAGRTTHLEPLRRFSIPVGLSLFFCLLLVGLLLPSELRAGEATLASLRENQVVEGFKTRAVYLDEAGRPMGARLVHVNTGFTLDFLHIESVHQAFLWVNSAPDSDMGEPHTQEHLLLGKGNRGRSTSNLLEMNLAGSSAYTMPLRTCYFFNTVVDNSKVKPTAGIETFNTVFESSLDSLLHPDYTDEEIRREVRNFGVSTDPATGQLVLDEKGTVYNEMVSSFERPWSRLGRELDQLTYGPNHPLSFDAGGEPSAIRRMTPEDIRRFHASAYRLDNMGMIASFPRSSSLVRSLRLLGEILTRQQATPPATPGPKYTRSSLPPARPAAPGSLRRVEYPDQSTSQLSPLALGWPGTGATTPEQQVLLELFLMSFAGDASTPLYRALIDTETRKFNLGASGIYPSVSRDLDRSIQIYFSDVSPEMLDESDLARVRAIVEAELQAVASYPDGSDELAAFNEKVLSRLLKMRRSLGLLASSPPGFGFRHTSDEWLRHVDLLEERGGFKRSLVLKDELSRIEKRLKTGTNLWRQQLAEWKLISRDPYVVAAIPSPQQLAREVQGKQARLDAELARIKAQFQVQDTQQALQAFKASIDQQTLALEAAGKALSQPPFMSDPPLTLDDGIDYTTRRLEAGIPLVQSTFPGMMESFAGLALDLRTIPSGQLLYVAALPGLLTQVGVIERGKPVPYQTMSDRLRREVGDFEAYFSTQSLTDRVELVVRGGGATEEEQAAAFRWIELALFSPDWRIQNLPRIRDVVDQQLAALRSTQQDAEEAWVTTVPAAWRNQSRPLFLATESFMTREQLLLALRWRLRDTSSASDKAALDAIFDGLKPLGAQLDRRGLLVLAQALQRDDAAAALPPPAQALAQPCSLLSKEGKQLLGNLGQDLELTLSAGPDTSLAADWTEILDLIRRELATSSSQALKELDGLRTSYLLRRPLARTFSVSAPERAEELTDGLESLSRRLADDPTLQRVRYPAQPRFEQRLRSRGVEPGPNTFLGLLNPSTSSGVFVNSTPTATPLETDPELLSRFLAAELLAGHGAHSLFMQTWAAGLAYSNGVRPSASRGRLMYYAERCPSLPQTLSFVIERVKAAQYDPWLAEYALAQAFLNSRAANSYLERGELLAEDLADGFTPELVARFRSGLLQLRLSPDLGKTLWSQLQDVYAPIMPGLVPGMSRAPGSLAFVIGPAQQLDQYESYLKRAVSPSAELVRLYRRDFWIEIPRAPVQLQPGTSK